MKRQKTRRLLSILLALCMVLALLPGTALAADGTTAHPITGGNIYFDPATGTITNCDKSVTEAIIPREIDGVPVTAIGDYAFNNCDALTSVTIPNTVRSIGEYAFANCGSLTGVTIPDGVASIGDRAFYYCEALPSVTIPDSVTSIGGWAFSRCTSLTSVTIPSGLSSISEYAFYYCEALPSVTIPNSVSSIGYHAFLDCGSLTSVTIPASVTSIGGEAFSGTPWLENQGDFPVVNGILISYQGSGGNVTIPAGVTSIGDYAFNNCTSLTSVTIPNGVTSIGEYAFAYCGSLTSATIPGSVSGIGDRAFYNCGSLTGVTIDDGVSSIGEYAFYRCTSLPSVTIPDSVTSIGEYAFFRCTSLASVTLPADITSIGGGAFSDTPWAEGQGDFTVINDILISYQGNGGDVTIPDGVTVIGECAFRNNTAVTGVTIPDGVTEIGHDAFYGCTGLTSVTIPEGVTSIGDWAFCFCSSLPEVDIPSSAASIGDSAFSNCTGLESVTIPEGVTSIGEWAFGYCDSLAGADIPASVTSIGKGAFDSCVSLPDINVASGNSAYRSVDGVLFNAGQTLLHTYPAGKSASSYNIPASVTAIEAYAFSGCGGLTGVTIPDGVTSIENFTFRYCDGITSAAIPASVTYIGMGAFLVDNLTDIYYGGSESQWNGIKIIEEGNYSLDGVHVYFAGEGVTSGKCGDNLTWILDEDGTLTISGTGDMYSYYGYLGDTSPWSEQRDAITAVVIENGATSIGAYAFDYCSNLTSVTIPDSVTSIGEGAFTSCDSLPSVTIPKGVTEIYDYAFNSCSSLTSVTILDGVTKIYYSAFGSCTNLTSVIIPVSVTDIGQSAFSGCENLSDVYYGGSRVQWEQIKINDNGNDPLLNAYIHFADEVVASGKCGDNLTWTLYDDGTLIISGTGDMYDYEMFYGEAPWSELRDEITAVVIENGATSIGKAAFWNCTGLTSVDIPNSVATIGNYAFTSCGSLAGVTIPDSVTYIGEAAFQNCTSLPRVTIPDSVTSVGMYAFSGCERLTSVTISKSITEINQSVFSESGLTSVTIPGNVTAIYSWAFGACSNLTSVTILDGVTEIGPQAFYECSSLASVIIPYSLTGVNYSAFDGCESLDDVYYGGTRSQWEEIDIDNTENGNDPLLNANIHFADEETHEPITLPNAVKYVPYSFALGLSALEDEGYSLSSYEVSSLPDWLEIDPETYKVYGVPMTNETYEFSAVYVYVLDGETITADVSYSLTVLDNSNSNVKLPNDYEILENIGTKDPDDPDNYLLTEYRDEKFIIDAPYEEFYRLLIDGVERTRDTDYTAEEGSVVLTIKAETFQEVGEGTHTVAADFRGNDASGRPTANTVSQNYTLTVNQPNNPGGGNTGGGNTGGGNTGGGNTGGGSTGGGGTGGGGGAGSAPASYGINVPDIPNCTVTLSATSASAGTVVTLTVQPYEGYELTTLTVTGPNGERLTLTQVGENQFTFQMPGGNVDISAQVQEKQPGNPSRGTPFVDVLETDWFYESVLTAYERGWLAGTSANTFSPYATSLRCMFVTVLHRIAGEPSPADNSYFSDVPSDQYYAPAAAWALEQGIVTGYGDGRFGSNDSITREQIVIILHNYANLIGMDTAARNDLSQFTDLDQLSAEAQQAMSWANAVGLISGKGDGILDPVGSATRAEMAALLVRFATLADM